MKKTPKKVKSVEVVINRCYGGFGVSPEAVLQLADAGCTHVETMTMDKYFETPSTVSREDHLRVCDIPHRNDLVFLDEHRHDYNSRTCPHLVAIVKKLGKGANGHFASLKVVKVPSNIKFTISEYDGIETIEEEHRSWR